MYIHIGNGRSVRDKDIIGIFDLDTATVSQITKKFISKKHTPKSILQYYAGEFASVSIFKVYTQEECCLCDQIDHFEWERWTSFTLTCTDGMLCSLPGVCFASRWAVKARPYPIRAALRAAYSRRVSAKKRKA